MANIDSLDIEISADSSTAVQRINNIVNSLTRLNNSLNQFSNASKSIQSISNISSGFYKLSQSVNSIDTNKLKDFYKSLNSTSRAINKLSASASKGINFSSMTNSLDQITAQTNNINNNVFENLSNSLTPFQNLRFPNSAELSNLAKALGKFSNPSIISAATNLKTIGPAIKDFMTTLNGLNFQFQGGNSLNEVLTAVAKLNNKKFVDSGNNLKKLAINIRELIATLNGQSFQFQGADNLSTLITAISKLGNKKIDYDGKNLRTLSVNLREFITTLNSMPTVGADRVAILQSIANITQGLNRGGSASNGNGGASGSINSVYASVQRLAGKGVALVRKFFNSFNHGARSSSDASKGFVSSIGMFYAKFFILIRAVKTLWKNILSAMNTVEVVNYFNAAMDQVISNTDLSKWEELGYESANAYAESFKKTLMQTTSQMTGYTLNSAGNFVSTNMKNLGIDPTLMTNYTAMFAQMSSSMGVASESATLMSRALVELGADLASVKNLKFDDVWQNMASGITGMSRAVDRYGINIRQASLQQELYRLGINANISALSQADKAMLRTIVMVRSTKYAWGDLSSTLGQPANQLRIVESQFISLGRSIGNLFLPIIAKVLPAINQLLFALRSLVDWIGGLFGIEKIDWGNAVGPDNSGLSNILDDTQGVSDNIGSANDNAKKLGKTFKQLQGFDKLNNMTTSDASSGGGAGGGSAGGASGIPNGLLNDAFKKALDNYQKKWDKTFKNMTSTYDGFTKHIKDAYENGGLEGVGEYLSKSLEKALRNIPWKDIYKAASNFGTGLADFLNGLIKPDTFDALGQAIANSINTALSFLNSFFKKFNWENLGESLGAGLNSFMRNIDWEKYLNTVKNLSKGIAKALNSFIKKTDFKLLGKTVAKYIKLYIEGWYNFVDTFDFNELGKKISDSINGFLQEMNSVDDKTGLNGWQKLSKSLSKTVTGLTDALIIALDDVEWEQVGQGISDFISSINWSEITWNLLSLAESVGPAIVQAFRGAMEKNPITTSIGTAIVALIGACKLTGLGSKLGETITSFLSSKGLSLGKVAIGLGLGLASFKLIKGGTEGDWKKAIAGAVTAGLAAFTFTGKISVGLKVVAVAAAFEGGFNFGKWLGKQLFPEDADYYINFKWENLQKAIQDAFSDPDLNISLSGFVEELFDNELNDSIVYWWKEIAKPCIDGFFKGIKDNIKKIPKNIKNAFNTYVVKPVKDFLGIHSPSKLFKKFGGHVIQGFKNGLFEKLKGLGDWAKDKLSPLGDVFSKVGGKTIDLGINIVNKSKETLEGIQKKWNDFKSNTKELIVDAKEKVKGALSSIATNWDKVKDKTAKLGVKVKEKAEKAISKLHTKVDDIKTKAKDIVLSAKDKASSIITDVKDKWKKLTGKNSSTKLKVGVDSKGSQKSIQTIENLSNNIPKSKKLTYKIGVSGKENLQTYKDFKKQKDLAKKMNFNINSKGNVKLDKLPDLATNWSNIDNKEATLTADIDDKVDSKTLKLIADKFKTIKDKDATLTTDLKENVKRSTLKDVGSKFSKIKSKNAKITTSLSKESRQNVDDVLAITKASSKKSITVTATLSDEFSSKLKEAVKKAGKFADGYLAGLGAKKKNGGRISNSGRQTNFPKKYAAGGIPSTGTLFWAGEAGAEVVAHANNGTEVLNQSQIAAAIATGVANANASQNGLIAQQNRLLAQQNSILMNIYEKGTSISANEVFNAVRNADKHYTKVNGHSAFA